MTSRDIADVVRVAMLVYGGAVVGIGLAVLRDRARMWRRLDAAGRPSWRDPAWRSVFLLACVNLLVMAYISAVLIGRWHHELSWRWVLALAIFTVKARMLWDVRLATLEQDRRLMIAERDEP
jgi:hypothetical protein